MVSQQAREEIERIRARQREDAQRFPEGKPLDINRREWEAQARLTTLPKGARFHSVDAAGVKCEWMEMPPVSPARVVLFMHGGGFVAGSPRTHRKLAAALSRAAYARILMPEYPLAPEHPFPAAVKDGLRVYGWLIEQGIAASDIVLGGDSAGGGLALSMLLALRDAGAALPRAAVLMSAWTDLTVSSPSYERNRRIDPSLTREKLRLAAQNYIGTRDLRDPLASPLFADPTGLPPLLLQVGGDEVMLDDSRLFAERARAAGVDATLRVFEGIWHVHQHHAPELPEALAAMTEIAAFIRAQFGD